MNKKVFLGLAMSLLVFSCNKKEAEKTATSADTVATSIDSTTIKADSSATNIDSIAVEEKPVVQNFTIGRIPASKITPMMMDTRECAFFDNKKDHKNFKFSNVVYLGTYDAVYLYLDGKLEEFKNSFGQKSFSNGNYEFSVKEKITKEQDRSNSGLEGAYAYDANLHLEITRLSDGHKQVISLYGECAGH